MINEYDHVRIKSTGICGIVIDISESSKNHIVESNEKGVPGSWWEPNPNEWSLFDCTLDDLEKV